MLDTYMQAEAQKLPQSALFHQDGASSHIKLAVPSLFVKIFPNPWIGEMIKKKTRKTNRLNHTLPFCSMDIYKIK